jgi:uncharacterized protein YrrD
MLQSIKKICGDKIGASDGEIGQVKDFYFDDTRWVVRYLVADTGNWLTGRQVLIAPHAFKSLYQPGKVLIVNLTRTQIENSPSIDTHKPVSRQYEEEYYRYYGWPDYWQGDGIWGMSGFPIVTEGAKPSSNEPRTRNYEKQEHFDTHLRSVQAIIGYQIQAGDEIVGSVADFMMDAKSWVIGQVVVNTGNRFTGKKVLLTPIQITRISYEESKVFVNLTKETFGQAPAFDDERGHLLTAK